MKRLGKPSPGKAEGMPPTQSAIRRAGATILGWHPSTLATVGMRKRFTNRGRTVAGCRNHPEAEQIQAEVEIGLH